MQHPELKPGEKFLLNVTEEEFHSWAARPLRNIEYVRLGEQAYCTDSLTPVDPNLKFRPMFAKMKDSNGKRPTEKAR